MAAVAIKQALPSEILYEVFERSKQTPGWEPDWHKRHKFLLDVAMVCKSWTGPAQAMLFREVRFPENEDDGAEQGILPILNTFLETMRRHQARGTGLPLAVRSLALTLGLAPSYNYSAKEDVDAVGCPLSLLVDIVEEKLLDALYHLELMNQGGMVDFDRYKSDPATAHLAALQFDQAQIDRLRAADRKIHALTLKIIEYDMPMFAQLITSFPALQYLDITGTEQISFADLDAVPGVNDIQNLSALRELRVNTGAIARDFADRLGQHNAVSTLHVKELAGLTQIESYRPNLARLYISEWRSFGDDTANTEELNRFPVLEELFVSGQTNQRPQIKAIVSASLRVRHVGVHYEATRLVSSKELVKVFQELLPPPGNATRAPIKVGVYASAMPFYLHWDIPPAEELTQFRTDYETPIEWFDEVLLFSSRCSIVMLTIPFCSLSCSRFQGSSWADFRRLVLHRLLKQMNRLVYR